MVKHHRTHYKKIKLNDDISLRYFFSFEDRPQLDGKWVIKSHNSKEYGIVDERTAKLIAMSHNKELSIYKEIMGRYIFEDNCEPIYRKVIIKGNKSKVYYEPNIEVLEVDKSVVRIKKEENV